MGRPPSPHRDLRGAEELPARRIAAWTGHWASTRVWEPLNTPVSLARGHVRTPEFEINAASYYGLSIRVNRPPGEKDAECVPGFECARPYPRMPISWTLTTGGREVVHGYSAESASGFGAVETISREVGGFQTGTGRYVLDLDVQGDGSYWNQGSPRLAVLEAGSAWRDANDMVEYAFAIGVLAFTIGVSLLPRGHFERWPVNWLTQTGPQTRNLQANSGPVVPVADGTGKRGRGAILAGAALVATALAGFWNIQQWRSTSGTVALDLPVSLRPGHIRTGPFPIGWGDWYHVWLVADAAAYDDIIGVQTRWTLYRNGTVARRSDGPMVTGNQLAGFPSEPGTYDLDVEVLQAAAKVQAAHPRLKVFRVVGPLDGMAAVATWLIVFGLAAGLGLLAVGGSRRVERVAAAVTHCEGSIVVRGAVRWKRREEAGRRSFQAAQPFLVTGCCLLFCTVPMALIVQVPFDSVGLRIHLLPPGTMGQRLPGLDPLLVDVRKDGIYVNSSKVKREGLAAAVRDGMKRRPWNWPVYVMGDPALDLQPVAEVIDTLQGEHVKVVLWTAR